MDQQMTRVVKQVGYLRNLLMSEGIGYAVGNHDVVDQVVEQVEALLKKYKDLKEDDRSLQDVYTHISHQAGVWYCGGSYQMDPYTVYQVVQEGFDVAWAYTEGLRFCPDCEEVLDAQV